MGAAVEAEAGMPPLPHRPHVLDPGRRHQQPDARVTHPERSQPLELLGEIEAESGAADHRVDLDRPHQVVRPEHGRGVGAEGLPERLDRVGWELEPGCGPVAAERSQVRGAGLEAGEEVEAGDAAPGAAASALAVERDHDRRPVVALGQARGDDPDDPGMPALPGDDDRRGLAKVLGQLAARRLGGRVDLLLGRAPLAVGAARARWRSPAARDSSSVRNSSTPRRPGRGAPPR